MSLLSLKNTRRFIFSKWTLKEGWDNPNVFNICKLRSSGSEISKLQEVRRGLRLPVDEYGDRLVENEYYLNYFVDSSESDFVEKLISEIELSNDEIYLKVGEKLSDEIIDEIIKIYNINEDDLLNKLVENKMIDKRLNILNADAIICEFEKVFNKENLVKGKVKNAKEKPKMVKIKKDLYPQIKKLWEAINQKVFLKYNANEDEFLHNFKEFLKEFKNDFAKNQSKIKSTTLSVKNEKLSTSVGLGANFVSIKTLNYKEFLCKLSSKLGLNTNTLHKAFYELLADGVFDINEYLNEISLNKITKEFNQYLLNSGDKIFKISYESLNQIIHPTKITDKNGDVLGSINANDIGVLGDGSVANEKFLYEEIFYDSEIEKQIINTNIDEVRIYLKIPKNSLKIPVAGGFSYSPDFAYVLCRDDKQEFLVLESKGVDSKLNLREEEKEKINHAKSLFKWLKISFINQFKNNEIKNIVEKMLNE